jgi:hypothetical protein
VGTVTKNILYIIKQDETSKRAMEILESSNINYKPIVIDLDGAGKLMWRDTRTYEVPSLLTPTMVYCGLEEISKFAHFFH